MRLVLASLACIVSLVLSSASSAIAQDAVAEARERVERALVLFDEGRYDAALAELERAYAIAPNYRVLYNLGRVHAMRGDAVRASDAYARYLEDGGAQIAEERRAEVAQRLAEQRARIGRVHVRVRPEGAEILVDGALVPDARGAALRAPLLEPLRLSAGRHRIGARAPNHAPVEVEIDVAGETEREVTLELVPTLPETATLRVRATLADVLVSVDGAAVGQTPLEGTVAVAPGAHVVEGRRTGYRTTRLHVVATAGAETEVDLELSPDPDARDRLATLSLRVPEGARVEVDGEVRAGPTLELPEGRHALRIEAAERRPHVEEVSLLPTERATLAPALEWLPEARERRVRGARELRTLGWASLVSGLVLVAALGPTFVFAQTELDRWLRERTRIAAELVGCGDMVCYEQLVREDAEALSQLDTWELTRALTGIGAALGVVLGVLGVPALVLAPSDADVDASARVALEVGPASLALRVEL